MGKVRTKEQAKKLDIVSLVFKLLGLAIVVAYIVVLVLSATTYKTAEFGIGINLFSNYDVSSMSALMKVLRIFSYIIFLLSISYFVRLGLKFIAKFLKKGGAVLNLIASLIKYVAVIVLIFLILPLFNVDGVTLVVGAGVVSLVIGLGAQSLISDVIAGLFIVFEEVFDIGDIIVVDGFRGTVKEIGIRTTQIVDWGGNIKVINNSDLRSLVNMTAQVSTALVVVEIEYGESIERVEAVIKDNLERMKNNIKGIIDGPYYIGVSNLGASGVELKFIAQCKESVRFQVERDMLREIKLIFDENDVGIPFTQITINQPKQFQAATKKDKKEAEEFIKEQKKKAKDIPTEENQIR